MKLLLSFLLCLNAYGSGVASIGGGSGGPETDPLSIHLDGTSTPSANISLNSKKITSLATPTASTDAATKAYVDGLVPDTTVFFKKDGSVTATGNFNLGGFKISSLLTPAASGDAATKGYVDGLIPDTTVFLKKDGTVTGTGDFNWGGFKLANIGLIDMTGGTLSSGTPNWIKATGTFPTDNVSYSGGSLSWTTNSGSAANQRAGLFVSLSGTNNAAATIRAGAFQNTVPSTGTDIRNLSLNAGVTGVTAASAGTLNVGMAGLASGNNTNMGLVAAVEGPGKNLGVAAYSTTNASNNPIAGYFAMKIPENPPTLPSVGSAIAADSASNTGLYIARFYRGGTYVAGVDSNGNLTTEKGIISTPATVSLTADDQAVVITNLSYIKMSSDNAVATARTFTINQGISGQRLTLEWTGTNAAEFADDGALTDAGNARLSAVWLPTQYDTLSLIFNGTDWVETARSTN